METLNPSILLDIFSRCKSDSLCHLAMSSTTLYQTMHDPMFYIMMCSKYGIPIPKSMSFASLPSLTCSQKQSNEFTEISFNHWKKTRLEFKKKRLWIRRVDSKAFSLSMEEDSPSYSDCKDMFSLENGMIAMLYLEQSFAETKWTVRFATTRLQSFIDARFATLLHTRMVDVNMLSKDSTEFIPEKTYSFPYQDGDSVQKDHLIQRQGHLLEWWNGLRVVFPINETNKIGWSFTMDWNDNGFQLEDHSKAILYHYEPFLYVVGESIPEQFSQVFHSFVAIKPPKSLFHLLLQWA
jgi:hypothetical protein